MSWWLRGFSGNLLPGGEMVTPGGFYLLFFGIGAAGRHTGRLDVIQSAWMSWLLFRFDRLLLLFTPTAPPTHGH